MFLQDMTFIQKEKKILQMGKTLTPNQIINNGNHPLHTHTKISKEQPENTPADGHHLGKR